MCDDCLNCLRSPLCPYCRDPLSKEMLSNNIHVQSAPVNTSDWSNMLNDELLINPYDPEFQDSRILRRQIRRMRRRYLSEQNRNRNRNRNREYENNISSRTRRANRRAERHFLRNSVRLNNRNSDLQFELEL